jgi:hypothetical protein
VGGVSPHPASSIRRRRRLTMADERSFGAGGVPREAFRFIYRGKRKSSNGRLRCNGCIGGGDI